MSYGNHRVDQRFINKARSVPHNERLNWLLKHKPVPVLYSDLATGRKYMVRMPALAVFTVEALFIKVKLDISVTSRIGNQLDLSSIPQKDIYKNEKGKKCSVFDPLRQYAGPLFRLFYQNNIPLSTESIALLEKEFSRIRLVVQDLLPKEYLTLNPAALWIYFNEADQLDELERKNRYLLFSVLPQKLKVLIVLYMQKNGVESTEQWMDRDALKAIVSAWTFESYNMMAPNKNEIPHLLFPLYPDLIANWTDNIWKKTIQFWLNNPAEVDQSSLALIVKSFISRFGEEGIRDLRTKMTPNQRGAFSAILLLASETALVHQLLDECTTALESPETRDASLKELNMFFNNIKQQEFKDRVRRIKAKFLRQLSDTPGDLATQVATLKVVVEHYDSAAQQQFIKRIQIDDTVVPSQFSKQTIDTMISLTLKSKTPILKAQLDELLRRSMLGLNREILMYLGAYIKENPGSLVTIWNTYCLADSQIKNIMTSLDWLYSDLILPIDEVNKLKNKLVHGSSLPVIAAPMDFTFCFLTLAQAAGMAIPGESLNKKGLYTPEFFHVINEQPLKEKRALLRDMFRYGSPALSQLTAKVRTDEQVYEALYHLSQYPDNLPYEVIGIIENILKSHAVLFPEPVAGEKSISVLKY